MFGWMIPNMSGIAFVTTPTLNSEYNVHIVLCVVQITQDWVKCPQK